MDSAEYYRKTNYKCFDKFHLLDIIFPAKNGLDENSEKVYFVLAYALKDQDYNAFNEAGDLLFELGLKDWANHVFKIALIIKKHQMKKLNLRKLK